MKNLEYTLQFLEAKQREILKKFEEANDVDNDGKAYDFAGIIGSLNALVDIAIHDIKRELGK